MSVRKNKQNENRFTVTTKASIRYGNSHTLICKLNKWYESLWKGAKDGQTEQYHNEA